MTTLRAAIDAAIERDEADGLFGRPTAAKRGRKSTLPFVPVVDYTHPSGRQHTKQLLGLAYATREEAVARAQRQIDANRAELRKQLAQPNLRALRQSKGLPRTIEHTTTIVDGEVVYDVNLDQEVQS